MKTAHKNGNIIDVLWQMALIVLMAVALSLGVNHFRRAGLPLAGDLSPKASSSGEKTVEEQIISIEEARALFLTNGAVFVDARPPEVYRHGHIRGALNLPLDSLDEFLPDFMAQIPPDSLIITYCDGQICHLSKEVALQLSAKGYSHVQVLVNGWSVWKDAGLPTENSAEDAG
ncbi:MAG: rhodanese-like domain-containing protein [Syntrophobacteraceae bacterium]|jgi:rhodanese-related sulfurtransferase